ncbi:hypothetical protein BBO99_00005085 [Phytophthora kernoviae]|uniref:Uncharacterized protein n=2 Tax=Phytophthora kernoviae TaxID=325452 RepID=A0A421F4M1_9STRA|nr:hypothetical protein G195_005544 [Phytophthora kernoviae 00238/432]KAG2523530.1 hypothetical protein JM16_004794 [Phytophthora kernoviae]KAG2525380.1 hypothetical protein JM18_004407 [Phytophthora kernoviae]RLN21430.1 hypothetical protein BBI17_005172 [Phytophthora kernoviae]RLN79674.1 hypothetical protein BBO99_00005085 [Phytophthora kernoviae]
MMETYAGDEAAYNEFLASHTKEMDTLAAEIEDVEKQAKAAERSIPAREKKVVAINKKTAQKKRVLGSWNEKNREKQEQLARSTATKTLVDSEELGLQEALKREQLGLESIMQQNAVREMEAEDLLSSCVSLEANIRQANKTLPIMKSNIAAAETSVKNRIDEIRDKFLNSFVISDSGNLIELLNKEVRSAVETP